MVFLSLEFPTELHEGFSKLDVQVLVNSLRSFWSRTHGRVTFVTAKVTKTTAPMHRPSAPLRYSTIPGSAQLASKKTLAQTGCAADPVLSAFLGDA